MHGFILVEADFPDVALHAAVDGHNLLAHLRVVGEFHVAQMDKTAAYPEGGGNDYGDGDYVGEYLFCTVFHIFPEVNRSL